MLHPIIHDNKSKLWCGPAAIALVTGQPTSVIHRLAHERRAGLAKRRQVSSMTRGELMFIMNRLGYENVYPGCLGAGGAVRRVLDLTPDVPVIAGTADHWFVIWGGCYVDNCHEAQRIAPDGMAHETVEDWTGWRKVREPELPAPKPRPPSASAEMREAKRLAKRYGITISSGELDTRSWYVHCPAEVDEVDDVLEDDHYASDPGEVLSKVETYVKLVEHCRANGGVLA